MRITRRQLKQIIREELMREGLFSDSEESLHSSENMPKRTGERDRAYGSVFESARDKIAQLAENSAPEALRKDYLLKIDIGKSGAKESVANTLFQFRVDPKNRGIFGKEDMPVVSGRVEGYFASKEDLEQTINDALYAEVQKYNSESTDMKLHPVVVSDLYTTPSKRPGEINWDPEPTLYVWRATFVQQPANYTVKPGDGLIKIAKMFDVYFEDIAAENNMRGVKNQDTVLVGQKLIIPVAEPFEVTQFGNVAGFQRSKYQN